MSPSSSSAPNRLTKESALDLIKNVDNFLFDCDGVVWNWPHAIAGSVECINKLKELGKRCFFVTNNSTKTRQMLLENIQKLGILHITEDDIVCTAWVLAQYLKTKNFTGKAYIVGNTSMGKELDDAGIRHLGIGSTSGDIPDPFSYDYKNSLKFDDEVSCVAVGFDSYFSYPKMILATSYGHMPNVEFIATNDDPVYPSGITSKVVIPGTGTFVKAVETGIGRAPLILGKPHHTMWEVLAKTHNNLDPARSCMVGDRLETDIAFAYNCSLKYSLAVLSGITHEAEILKYWSKSQDAANVKSSDDIKCVPTFYTPCLGDFEKFLLE